MYYLQIMSVELIIDMIDSGRFCPNASASTLSMIHSLRFMKP